MYIKVTDCDTMTTIFSGDAEEFLANNDYDEEIEEKLNELDANRIGSSVVIAGFVGNMYMAKSIYEDEVEVA